MANKPILTSEAIQRKEFSYTLGITTLKFTLRTDVKVELKAFKEMALQAIKDIDAELAKLSEK